MSSSSALYEYEIQLDLEDFCFLLLFTYLAGIFDESPGLFLDTWHVWIRGADQSRDFCGPNEAVLHYWPAEVKTRGGHIRLHWPVGV